MTEVGKSLRMEAALSDAITRRAEANGQSFTAYVIEVLERSLQEPQATSSSNPASAPEALLAPLRGEMTSLRDVLRAERLGHSEVVDAILGLSRVAKEFESERQRMVEVVAKACVELDKAKEDLKRMAEVGGVASKTVKESSASLVKAFTETNTAALATLQATEKNLRQMEVTAEKVTQIAASQRETFEKTTRDFTREVKENAREFLSNLTWRWRIVMTSALVVLLAGAGASAFWIFVNQSEKVARAEQGAVQERVAREAYQQGSYYLLQEVCEGRRPKVARRFCAFPGGPITENPYR